MPFIMRPAAEGESLGQLQKGWVAQHGAEAVGISPFFDTRRMLLRSAQPPLAKLVLVAKDAAVEKKSISARQKRCFLLEANMVGTTRSRI